MLFYIYWIPSDKNRLKQADEAVLDIKDVHSKPNFNLCSNWFTRLAMVALFGCAILIWIFYWPGFLKMINQLFTPSMACYYYFCEVLPLPPGKSKVRQWLESFGKVLKPIPVRNR